MSKEWYKDLQRLRDAGKLEQCSTARHALEYYRNVHIGATYSVSEPEFGRQPLKSRIYRALAQVIQQHSILSAVPVDEHTAKPYFVRLPIINLDDVVSFHAGDFEFRETQIPAVLEAPKFNKFLDEHHDLQWEPSKPFWKLFILQGSPNSSTISALFFFHHALADGGSGMAFHRAFHAALEKSMTSETNGEASPTVQSPNTPLLPNIELVSPMTVSWSYFLRMLFRHYIWQPPRDPGLWTGGKAVAPAKTTTRTTVFSADATSSFIATCRMRKTTLTACLQIIVARAFFKFLPAQVTKVHYTGAMSQRQHINDERITDDIIGVFVQAYNEMYSRDSLSADSFPWAEATKSRDTILETLALKGADTSANMLRYVSNMVNYYKSQSDKDRSSTFEISNLGLYKPYKNQPAHSTVSISRMFFSQSMGVTNPAFVISAATGPDGALVLTYTWQDEIVSDELTSKVVEDVCTTFLKIVG